MSVPDAYCELCDLPLATCVHGQPPPAPAAPVAPKPRKRATTITRTSAAQAKPVIRRWTPPEVFKPLILAALQEAGGELDTEDLYLELEIRAEDMLLPGDSEAMPGGELRWQYAARRARVALVEEGLMTKGKPGIWGLADPRGTKQLS